MKKLEISNEDLLKNWDTEDLVLALTAARQYSIEPIIGTSAMWVERADAYAAELNRRAN
jgi:hypothetical protein